MKYRMRRFAILPLFMGLALVIAACAPPPASDSSEVQELRKEVSILQTQVASVQPDAESDDPFAVVAADDLQSRSADLRVQMSELMQQSEPDEMVVAQVQAQMQELMKQMQTSIAAGACCDEQEDMHHVMDTMGDMTGMMGQMQGMMGDDMDPDTMNQMMGMIGDMTGMMGQMQGMMGDDMGLDAMDQMMGMTGEMMDQMQDMMGNDMGPDTMDQMIEMMGEMTGMMGQMQGMMGEGMGQPGVTTDRQAKVAERGAQVMPFNLEQTIHIFKNLDNGGLQQVVVKEGADGDQVRSIQLHLSQEAEKFRAGDFSDPAQIHGDAMPGLALLREQANEIDIRYTPLDFGAQLEYISDDPELVAAIHDWFDAQLSDHGMDATNALPSALSAQPTAGKTLAETEQSTQSIEGGGVTVQITPLTLTDKIATTLDFEIVLNTHSVELDANLADLAVLLVDGQEVSATDWQTPTTGGHHVTGVLSFPTTGIDGQILLADATNVSLVIRDLAEIPERIFTWELAGN